MSGPRRSLAIRGRLLVRTRAALAPPRIPPHADVVAGALEAALRFDVPALDRAVRHHAAACRVTRAYQPARRLGSAREGIWDDLEVETGMSRIFRLEVDPDADLTSIGEALRALDAVEWVAPHVLAVTPFSLPATPPSDPFYAQRLIGAAEARRREPGDSALIIGVVDSGVDLDHPEFGHGSLRPGADLVDLEQERMGPGVELFGDTRVRDTEARDDAGHGTQCAGIIGARGLRVPPGLAGACRLLPVRVLAGARMRGRDLPTAVGALADIDAGLKRACDLGARVLNLSFGTPEHALGPLAPQPHADVVAYARRRGCVLVAASGNSGETERYFPAAMPEVIAVGAVGEDARPTRFTTRGGHVDLCAPGASIPAPTVRGYAAATGTSFASPFVAAAAALLVAHGARRSTPVGPDAVRDLLVRTARPFAADARAEGCGSGVLDVPAALDALHRRIRDDALREGRSQEVA